MNLLLLALARLRKRTGSGQSVRAKPPTVSESARRETSHDPAITSREIVQQQGVKALSEYKRQRSNLAGIFASELLAAIVGTVATVFVVNQVNYFHLAKGLSNRQANAILHKELIDFLGQFLSPSDALVFIVGLLTLVGAINIALAVTTSVESKDTAQLVQAALWRKNMFGISITGAVGALMIEGIVLAAYSDTLRTVPSAFLALLTAYLGATSSAISRNRAEASIRYHAALSRQKVLTERLADLKRRQGADSFSKPKAVKSALLISVCVAALIPLIFLISDSGYLTSGNADYRFAARIEIEKFIGGILFCSTEVFAFCKICIFRWKVVGGNSDPTFWYRRVPILSAAFITTLALSYLIYVKSFSPVSLLVSLILFGGGPTWVWWAMRPKPWPSSELAKQLVVKIDGDLSKAIATDRMSVIEIQFELDELS